MKSEKEIRKALDALLRCVPFKECSNCMFKEECKKIEIYPRFHYNTLKWVLEK